MALYNNTVTGESNHVKFYNSARSRDRTRSKQWLNLMIQRDKIYYRNKKGNATKITGPIVKKRFSKKLFELIDIFERKFDDNWDIHLEYHAGNKSFEISFIIHYKEILITNSEEESRTLTDLLVVLPISYNGSSRHVYIKEIQGTRLTLDKLEWTSGYQHSHLPRISKIAHYDNPFNAKKFCIGTDDLSIMMIELSMNFDIDYFELLLYTIDSLVSWESLEGGPHVKMNTIISEVTSNKVDPDQSSIETLYNNFEEYYLKDLEQLLLEFVYVNNRYQIKQNSKFVEFIKNAFLNHYHLKQYIKYFFCKKGTDGNYYTDSRIINGSSDNDVENMLENMKQKRNGELPFIYIQGKKIHFNITSTNTNPLNINEFGIHPKFLNYVTEQLESKIYEACVRGSSLNRLSNSNSHVRSFSGQD